MSRPLALFRLVGASLAAALLLTSCSATARDDATDPVAGSSASEGFPRTVTHVRGTAEIPSAPQRIVALDNSFADAVLLLEGTLVGYTDYRAKGLPDYLGDARETYAGDATSVGVTGSPSLEAVAALEPDLILSADVRDGDRYDTLAAMAPTVFTASTGPTWKENIRLVAQALGKEALAEQKISAYESRAASIGTDVNAKHGDPTISVVRFAGEPTARLYRSTSFSGIILEDAGLARPASQQADPEDPLNIMNAVSQELITEAEADFIFVSTYADPEGATQKMAEPFLQGALWKRLQGTKIDVEDTRWMLPVSIQGAHLILDDLAETLEVDPHTSR